MVAPIEKELSSEKSDALKNWMMVALTLFFVLLYAAALIGWLRPLADISVIARLEPIIFVIIGYYFGRFPSQQNEKTLKDEIDRQTRKADAAQHIKEQAQNEREVIEEKIKNAKVALNNGASAESLESPSGFPGRAKTTSDHTSLEIVRRILDS
ncbi:MAG: hypothetical protein ACRD6X_12185 [Pyrinomonadaceae bacterium]